MLKEQDYPLVIKTLPGLEAVLMREVKKLGGRETETLKRGVRTRGDLGFVYKANLWLRTALRVLVQIKHFQVRDEDHLYREMKKLPWEELFDVNQTFAIDASVFSDRFRNSLYVAQRAKDGIVDRFREQSGRRPNVRTQNPEIRINIHLQRHFCTVSLDSSGESLHKRQYRGAVDAAPINEVLAAGILELMDYQGHQALIDPMCGSGTFLIEAALKAQNIPPNVFRKEFSFQHWQGYDAALFQLIFDKSLEKEEALKAEFWGLDRDAGALNKARRNAKQALMDEVIELRKQDFTDWKAPERFPSQGTLIMNPPYDHKLAADIPMLYRGIGDSLKQHFAGYSAWIFTASEEGIKNIGLKPSRKIELINAKLPSWLLKYELY